jgi:sialidase-1
VGPTGTNTNESMIAQLAGGELVCNLRSTSGRGRRAVSTSTDDGQTWSMLTHHEQLIGPVCQAGLLTVPAKLTPDGREWLVLCNPASSKRERLTLKVSFDGGATWPRQRLLNAGPAAYSCLTLLPQGGIGVLYERGERSASEAITFARVPLEWLLQGDDHE